MVMVTPEDPESHWQKVSEKTRYLEHLAMMILSTQDVSVQDSHYLCEFASQVRDVCSLIEEDLGTLKDWILASQCKVGIMGQDQL